MARLHYIFLPIILFATITITGCTDDFGVNFDAQSGINYRGEPVDAFLDITVAELSVSMETRADRDETFDPYEDSKAERWVNDLWIFQYDDEETHTDTYCTLIADPIYLTISDQETLKNLPATLRDNDGDAMLIYVVTNTGSKTWGNKDAFKTVQGLLNDTIPQREPIFVTTGTTNGDLSIPMAGNSGTVLVSSGRTITVPVERMFAKIMIDPSVHIEIDDVEEGSETAEGETEVYSISIGNIPLYCQVGTLYTDDALGGEYPNEIQWITRAFSDELDADTYDYPYVVYVPENLQGQTGNSTTSKLEDDDAPAHALSINAVIAYTDEEGGKINYPYTFYPGANTTNDYNIKRNNVYRVKLDISALSMLRVPSANCLFAFAGETIAFFPYYRVETGGGYAFEDYLYPSPGDGETNDEGEEWQGSKIASVKIIWQTENCIGDNTDGTLVYLKSYTNDETHNGYEKIYVKTQSEGNALIGAYDSDGNIIWSWHIWVRTADNGDPTDISRAKTYYTYYWDDTGIYSMLDTDGNDSGRERRVAGYQLMSCNLGALQDEPNFDKNKYFGHDPFGSSTTDEYKRQIFEEGDGVVRTFGMLYQWGRKDPFPPMTTTDGMYRKDDGTSIDTSEGYDTGYYVHNYDDKHTEQHYDNSMEKVSKTSYGDDNSTYDNYLFHSHVAKAEEGMRYAIAHPTVFLSGASKIAICLDGALSENNSDYTSPLDDKEKSNYAWEGAWSDEDHDNKEWGGIEPDESTMKHYSLGINDDAGNSISLWDNYEDETGLGSKSIFDPCPYGWRVASGELWLGFTKNGINPYNKPLTNTGGGNTSNVNFDYTRSCLLGMTMYLGPSWRTDPTTWFPCQGFRLPDGSGYRVGGCGNYVNANTGKNDRINIVHLHYQTSSFKQFETQIHYTAKSTGNPLRCVRDSY